jgi:hypothetical protein
LGSSNADTIIIGYADTDFSSDELRHLIYSYIFILAYDPTFWRVVLQDRIALLTCELEARAVHAMKEAVKQAIFQQKACSKLED